MSEHTHHHDHEPTASECADFLERIVYFLDNELELATDSGLGRGDGLEGGIHFGLLLGNARPGGC